MKENIEQGTDLRCIWMTAGIINYKLCDHDFHCDTCEFHKVMQRMLPHTNPPILDTPEYPENPMVSQLIDGYLHHLFSDCKISLDRFQNYSHLWFKIESPQVAQVGIDKLMMKMVEPVSRIILPEEGENYRPEQLIAWVVRREDTFPLYTPVAGKISQINPLFHKKGFRFILDREEYFFKMENKDIERAIKNLCSDVLGLECYSKKVKLLRKFLLRRFQSELPENIGLTLQDGGVYHDDLEKVLGSALFKKFVKQLIKGGSGNHRSF